MKTLLFLSKGFIMIEASAFIDVMGWASNDHDMDTKVITCGFSTQVISAFNVPVSVDILIDNIIVDEYDALAIPAGFEEFGFYEDAYDEKFFRLIREFNDKGKIIASVCVGALPLGKSGVLKNRRATTYNLKDGYRQKQLKDFDVLISSESIVVDENIITSNSPGTAIHVAFKLLEMLTTKEKMEVVRASMGY